MISGFRSCVLAAGAAALLSAQAVYAVPTTPTKPAVDPLVSLSLLGTSQSRAALCSGVANCSLPAGMAMMAASAAQDTAAPPPPPPQRRRGVDPLVLLLGGVILTAIMVALLTGGGDGDGDLAPISPV